LKTHAYQILHYGVDYVSYALQSVYNQVEQIHVLYTPHPTHGYKTEQPPIESREAIMAAVATYDPEHKIKWYDIENVWHEGQHRDLAVEICRKAGADVVLVVDCDEIWQEATLKAALELVANGNKRNWLINFTHFWHSFDWVCRDEGWPVRFMDLRQDGKEIGYIPKEFGEIYHFGYAVRDSVMAYKWLIHGHKAELRPDWFVDKWSVWPPPADCHPTNDKGFWSPMPFDKSRLPEIMKSHPFYNLRKIE
jgi:hypothetical protein